MNVTRSSPSGPDPAAVAELLEKQAIHEVVLRYCRGIDRMDEAVVRGCYHPDATDTHGAFHGTIDEFVEWAFRLLGRYAATMHLVANHLSTIAGDVAVAETYGISHHRSDDPDPRRNLTVGLPVPRPTGAPGRGAVVDRPPDRHHRMGERRGRGQSLADPRHRRHRPPGSRGPALRAAGRSSAPLIGRPGRSDPRRAHRPRVGLSPLNGRTTRGVCVRYS